MTEAIDLSDYVPKEDIPINWRLKKVLKEMRELNEGKKQK